MRARNIPKKRLRTWHTALLMPPQRNPFATVCFKLFAVLSFVIALLPFGPKKSLCDGMFQVVCCIVFGHCLITFWAYFISLPGFACGVTVSNESLPSLSSALRIIPSLTMPRSVRGGKFAKNGDYLPRYKKT